MQLRMKKKRGVVLYIKEWIHANQVFKDNEGRYIGVVIEIKNQKILVCNIYCPNGPKLKFIKDLNNNIVQQEFNELIILGDFNGVVDATNDKSSSNGKQNKGKTNSGQLPKQFLQHMKNLNLIDIWRHQNEKQKDYTFYSGRHESWSHIDMAWLTNALAVRTKKIKILPRILSDHCALELTIKGRNSSYRWRLNENLLKKEKDIELNRKLLKEYLDLNKGNETSKNTQWEALKAVMRGYLIQQNSIKNKNRNKEIKEFIENINIKEELLKKEPTNKKVVMELEMLKKQLQILQTDKIEKQLKYIKQNHFQNANKIGKWLVKKIKDKKQRQHIIKIQKDGITYLEENKIADQFINFYKELYKKEVSKESITKYICNLNLPKLKDEQRKDLNNPITIGEIDIAIRKLKNNKAPGPDGFTAIFYKIFKEKLGPLLKDILNNILDNKEIPISWQKANISLIHKENTEPTEIKNYRPISLLNHDYKIFTTIMAERLKNFMRKWISEEQVGFLPNRQIKDNIRILIDTIEYYEKHNEKQMALLFIDAEKAFDKVNWDYLKLLLKELDIGFKFKNAVEAIYSKQVATLIINGQEHRKSIQINRGTRQGCPLSPLLFILIMETLVRKVSEDKNLEGLRNRSQNYKMRTYADDVVCIIENPKKNINCWLDTIEEFGKLAGFTMNKQKTKILTKNIDGKGKEHIQQISGLKIENKVKYLGVTVTSSNAKLLKNNYEQQWSKIKKDMEKWKYQNISLLGRIAITKMSILPKLLFLFQTLPIIRNDYLFKKWNTDITKFIWKNKKPRIKLKILTDDKKRGGLGLPDLKSYYEACNLVWVKEWTRLKNTKLLSLEGHDLRSGWHDYVWYNKRKTEKNYATNMYRGEVSDRNV
uniref:Reverse transcriptase domain-containing protein n=1 Tax=Anolis carolinensis TaxID=28377 RepID=A0A803TEV0_ANOCA